MNKKYFKKIYFMIMMLVMLIPYITFPVGVFAEDTGANKIGTMVINSSVSNSNPASGLEFTLNVSVGAQSYGPEDIVKDVVVTIPVNSSDKLEYELPTGDNFIASVENGNIVLKYDTFTAGNAINIPIKMKFKEGVSLPIESLVGTITATAANADSASYTLPETHPYNDPIKKYMTVSDETKLINPYLAHSGYITLTPENKIAGLNITNGKLRIDFPKDIEISAVWFNNADVKNQIQTDSSGNYFLILDINNFNVDATNQVVKFDYLYPMLEKGDLPEGEHSKDYEIKATFTGNRYNGEEISEEGNIKETLDYYEGAALFSKLATKEIYKKEGQTINYVVKSLFASESKDVSIIDNPHKENDFFTSFKYDNISWDTNGNIASTFYYQTNKNSTWIKGSGPSLTGNVDVSSLNLSEGEYVTLVKLDLSVNGSSTIPARSGEVNLRLIGKTTDKVVDESLSTSDNIVNTAQITGNYLNEEGVFTPMDTEKDAVTVYIPEVQQALIGFAGWEQPFYNKDNVTKQNIFEYGDSFGFQITPQVYPQAYGGTSDLRDAVYYLRVPKSFIINPEDVKFPGYEQGKLKIKPTTEIIEQESYNLVKVNYNATLPMLGDFHDYRVVIENIHTDSTVNEIEYVRSFLGSLDSSQQYISGVASYQGIPPMMNVPYAISNATVTFKKNTSFVSENLVSTDHENYKYVKNVKNKIGGSDVDFRLTVENVGTSNTDYMELIAMLPFVDDTVATNDINKNSTLAGNLKSITLGADSSDTDLSNYQFYYSTNATAENNKNDLQNTGVSGYKSASNWQVWDGTSELPSNVKAIKIGKKDGLDINDKIQLNLNYHVPEKKHDIDSLWLSFGYGGYYAAGNNKNNIVVAEPRKSGVMVGDDPVKSLSGHTWKDENNNGIREDTEELLPNYPVYLVNKDNDIVDQTTTDANGYYEFKGLFGAEYRVIVFNASENPELSLTKNVYYADKNVNDFTMLPNNDAVYDYSSWLNDQKGKLSVSQVDLTSADISKVENVDAGYAEPRSSTALSISGNIWLDTAVNGVWQSIEEMYSGRVTLNLYKEQLDGSYQLIKTTTSDDKGYYEFSDSDLTPGNYVVGLKEVPKNYKPTVFLKDMKFSNKKDTLPASIADPFVTTSFHVDTGEDSANWNLGLIETVDVYLTKNWSDGGNISERPSSIDVQLKKNGVAYNPDGTTDVYTITPTAEGNWETLEIKGLEKYRFSQGLIVENSYDFDEINVPKGYTSTKENVSDEGESNVYRHEITNTLNTIDLTVTKTWKDFDNANGTRPDSILVQLYRNGIAYNPDSTKNNELIEIPKSALSADNKNEWKYVISNLPKVNAAGENYTYTLEEVRDNDKLSDVQKNVLLYKSEVVESITKDTEEHKYIDLKNTLETVDIYVTKKWINDDISNRPLSIDIQLKKNNVVYNQDGTTKNYTIKPTSKGTWNSLEIKNLEKYRIEEGKRVENKYEVDEVNVAKGYESTKENISNEKESDIYRYEITNTFEKTVITTDPVNKTMDPDSLVSKPTTKLPSTGEKQLFSLYAIGGLLLLLFVTLTTFFMYKKYKKIS